MRALGYRVIDFVVEHFENLHHKPVGRDLAPWAKSSLKFALAQQEDQSMKRSRFSEEQIIGILKEHEAGVSVADLCRKHGVSDRSIYKWKAKYGGMDVSEAKRLRTVEEENARLKRLLADAMLDNVALKDLLGKKW
jgi:putative transposase